MLRCCLNPKVIGALAAAGIGVYLLSPGHGAAAFPLLITLICPLSMGVMMWRMRNNGGSCEAPQQSTPPTPPTAQVTSSPADLPTAHSATDRAGVSIDDELRALREEITIARARQQLATSDERN